ncbi:MAG: NADH-ubiquinone oxidoreductase-F iron-sulfur binding region domain-containing protein, partial [Methylacidiphilaceae bacterium]|nr:NADH-ubiquinone oxidoreductase-F iron-sulfur binding region domain-containing protein [Candidatus Methylacidiphilaceae bacterium]
GETYRIRRANSEGTMEEIEMKLEDLPLDFDTIAASGSMSGSGGIIVMDETRDMVECLNNLSAFYAHESCGQCTPCREGALWMHKILDRMAGGEGRPEDPQLLLDLADQIAGRTICAFGEACSWPVESFVAKFREEFEAKAAQESQERERLQPAC